MTSDNTDIVIRAVDTLISRHGGVRAAARALNINYAYLSGLWNGIARDPTDAVLKKLGLEKIVTYRRIK